MIPEVLASCFQELDSIADPGQELSAGFGQEEFFTRPFVILHALSAIYTARTAMGLALDLGWEDALRRGATVDELLKGLRPISRIPAEWILSFLAEKGLLIRDGNTYRLEGTPCLDLQELREAAELEAPGHLYNLDLLDSVRSHVRRYFTEGKSGESCLFDLKVFPLWLDYFRNENILYRPNNVFALAALLEDLKPGSRILELGAGAGSFALLLARVGSEQGILDRISEYRYTDIAPSFLRGAQRGLRDLAPGIPFSFSYLDINRPLDDQGMQGAAFDAIVGVNVLHVAKNLIPTLADLRQHLAPGGRLILGECLKPDLDRPIHLEFFFQFMSRFTEVSTDPVLRTHHGFLTPEIWIRALECAGYRNVHDVPSIRPLMDRYPAFYVGAFSGTA